jgi:hypothetical protein
MSRPVRVTIRRENAVGETVTFETTFDKGPDHDAVYEQLLPMFRACDRRQFELNLRVLETTKRMHELDPTHYGLMRNILAGLNNILIEEREPAAAPDNGDGR